MPRAGIEPLREDVGRVGAKILMCKEGLSSLANTFVALPGQTALLDGIVDGEVEISYAGPRVGNGALH